MGEGDITIRTTKDTKLVDDDAAEVVYRAYRIGSVESDFLVIQGHANYVGGYNLSASSITNNITLADVARRTGLSRSTLRRHARDGKLGALLVRGRWVTTELDFLRYMEQRLAERGEAPGELLSDWYIVVRGQDSDLEAVADLCRLTAEHSLQIEAPGEWRLRSRALSNLDDAETAWSIAQDLLMRLCEAAAGGVDDRIKVQAASQGRTRSDGTSDVWVHPDPNNVRLREFPATVTRDGVVDEPRAVKLLRLQSTNADVRLALHFLNQEESWFNLYKAFEVIRGGSGRKAGLVDAGATEKEISRFTETANSYAELGDAARHGDKRRRPPEPMTIREADAFVRSLLSRWVASL